MSCRILHRDFRLPLGFSLHLTHEVMGLDKKRRRAALAYCALGYACVALLDIIKAFLAILTAVLFFALFWHPAANAAQITIPKAAHQYRAILTGVARSEMGLSAPVALLAAQIHQESRWNEKAFSPAGAQGLAQFMPATAKWLPEVAPHTGDPMPFNPAWSIRAMVAYDKYLFSRIKPPMDPGNRWAFTLCAYNGGLGWVNRDRAKAGREGYDPSRFWESVEYVNAGRSAANFRENREYPRRIFTIQRAYEAAGWGQGVPRD